MAQVAIIVIGVIILIAIIALLVLEVIRYVRQDKQPVQQPADRRDISPADRRDISPADRQPADRQPSDRQPADPSPPIPDGNDGMRPSSMEPITDTTENLSYTSVVDTENKRTIKSGNIISIACNGPTMFYLYQDQSIEAVNSKLQPRRYRTNLKNATQIHIFDQVMYAVEDGKLMVAGKPKNGMITFVRVPIFSTIDNIKRITSRANRFAIVLKNGYIHVYQHRPKFEHISTYEGVDFFFAYDENIFAVLKEGNVLQLYGKTLEGSLGYEEQEDVLTMAYQKNNVPVIISSDRSDVVAIESYFGNIYIIVRR